MTEIQCVPVEITAAPDSPIMQKIKAAKKYKKKCCKKYKKGKQCKRCPKLRACHLPKAFREEPFKI
ncbi:MAG TPA: hypothetical protein VJ953_21160 [Saprospiraceae bacterium]|nr:hypothetical protein [Saprospiraceae bacterium]